ncbi:MAG: hypothetical protein WED09_07380 [Homoserinimonas sp.]
MIDPGTGEVITDPKGRPVVDPEEIEAQAEWARARLAAAPVSGQIKTPDAVIEDLEWAKHLSAKSAVIIRDADKSKRAIARVHSLAHGKALKSSTAKSAELREADAAATTEETRVLLDAAEVAYQFARDVARSVESSTSAIQTQASMVKVTYGLAGSGREQ